jgi:hypothetical protein
MRMALLVSGLSFLCLASLLIWARARAELQRQQLALLELDAAELGLLEEHS